MVCQKERACACVCQRDYIIYDLLMVIYV
uniref:Uncharacterized protein n=1 Tax=Anguilla anguilla TaxID=7936 RepID=A0A0E9UVD0_ANGAN